MAGLTKEILYLPVQFVPSKILFFSWFQIFQKKFSQWTVAKAIVHFQFRLHFNMICDNLYLYKSCRNRAFLVENFPPEADKNKNHYVRH